MNELRPQHFSVRAKPGRAIRPRTMESIRLPEDGREALEEIALGIFTDMVNAGMNFHETLTAIYLSGLQHGAAACAPFTTNVPQQEK